MKINQSGDTENFPKSMTAPTKTTGYNINNIRPTSGFIFIPFFKIKV